MSFDPDDLKAPPFETLDLRTNLAGFLDSPFETPSGEAAKVGNFRWGVYAFFDYDGEPIYVGQTNEMLRTRIRRHLTNQRTDAVAMSVLDPFEVLDIEVWPLPYFQDRPGKDAEAKAYLDQLERTIYETAIRGSTFGAILNEKEPPAVEALQNLPQSLRSRIVSDEVLAIRSHPDVRIARRAQIIARLAQVISERKVQKGLRNVLVVQAKRLEWLAERRQLGLHAEPSDESSVEDED